MHRGGGRTYRVGGGEPKEWGVEPTEATEYRGWDVSR